MNRRYQDIAAIKLLTCLGVVGFFMFRKPCILASGILRVFFFQRIPKNSISGLAISIFAGRILMFSDLKRRNTWSIMSKWCSMVPSVAIMTSSA